MNASLLLFGTVEKQRKKDQIDVGPTIYLPFNDAKKVERVTQILTFFHKYELYV